ncbi:MAG TPA: hypothetical protein P5243_01915 [Bacteroidales bacterium]|nr:hypothetical protein [Bacteroidales bacterium]
MVKLFTRHLITVISALLFTCVVYAQDEFMIHGRIQTIDNSIEGATVRVMHDYLTIKKIILDKTGAYTVYLPYGKNYSLLYEKKGYQTIQIDALLDLPKDVKQCCYRPLELSFHLTKPDSTHGDMFNKAFHTIQYDKNYKGFIYDIDIDYMIQQRIVNAQIFKQTLLAAQEGNSSRNDSILVEKKYLALINQGTEYYNQKQFYAARKFFLEASKIKPERMYPQYKLEDIKTELQRFETKAELLGINLDSLVAKELAAIEPKIEEKKPYPPYIPLTDAQVEEIFKNDLKKQILKSSSNVAEANRTIALMNELFKDDMKKVTTADFKKQSNKDSNKPEIDKREVGIKPKQTNKQVEVAKATTETKKVEEVVQKPKATEPNKEDQQEKIQDIADVITSKPEKKPITTKETTEKPVKKVVDYNTYQDSLRARYPDERTIEVTQDAHKKTTRVFMNNGKIVEIYAMVEHAWGATYYFIEEYPSGAQSIGYAAFMSRTKLYDLQNNKPAEIKDSVPAQKK